MRQLFVAKVVKCFKKEPIVITKEHVDKISLSQKNIKDYVYLEKLNHQNNLAINGYYGLHISKQNTALWICSSSVNKKCAHPSMINPFNIIMCPLKCVADKAKEPILQ